MQPINNIYTVSELTEKIRCSLEKCLPYVWVSGEVTNFSRSSSGHIYFSLKDELSQLQCIWFAGKQARNGIGSRFDPLTGEVYSTPRPHPADIFRNGLEVECGGRITVYAPRGQYQLMVDFVRPSGEGALAMAFAERRNRLAKLGYFDAARKRKLPVNASHIALVTSEYGAAIHDFCRIANQRGLSATIRLYPVTVQGENAAAEIAAAIDLINSQKWADIVVLIRGGGSLEDLWAFNEEAVVQAIFDSDLPVLTGIGHEIDFTLADFTADGRAATPTHAAQMLWPLRRDYQQKVDELDRQLQRFADAFLDRIQEKLNNRNTRLTLLSPLSRLERLEEISAQLQRRLEAAVKSWFDARQQKFVLLAKSCMNIARLYEKTDMQEQRLLHLVSHLQQVMDNKFLQAESRLGQTGERLEQSLRNNLKEKFSRLDRAESVLNACNPLAPLGRGYALIYADGHILRSVSGLARGQAISAQLQDGLIEAEITALKPEGRGK